MIHHTAPAEVAAGIETFIREIQPPAITPAALETQPAEVEPLPA
jgi:hypothetical protein